ncbi:tRNA (adenine(58)-N(1))-methyltransferase, mitochondrial [Chanos chanos]|uniref:tRNA (adenine(58)-N(1))-methyltransferase n=1 Tax=Chanos chanos TaxID=29144 RepID=A0A6J2WJ10_CHACN|nr:tRNA (adenine(58)-N(1))-methyltransferase, mitochondrial [Chanos chanos]
MSVTSGSLLKTLGLARFCVTCLRQQSYSVKQSHIKVSTPQLTWRVRNYGTGPSGVDGEGNDPDAKEPGGLVSLQFSKRAAQLKRRRPLSPLERVSRLLPEESLSQEVWELRETKPKEEEEQTQEGQIGQETLSVQTEFTSSPQDKIQRGEDKGKMFSHLHIEVEDMSEQPPYTLPGERPMCFGEVLFAQHRRKRQLLFQKMFQLKEGERLQSNWGVIAHEEIAGCPAGTVLRTSLGLPILVRRPSLEEFTLFMKRGPAIAYPKDASAMLMMMDVSEGDYVLESGSGSGAMTLFLSRAVGSNGRVLSVEVREDHHRRAVLNYQRWRSSWSLRRGGEWPDNVQFHCADLLSAKPLLSGKGFNSIALDMVNPHLVLPTVVPHLHPGGVCAVYQANVTQIIDLLEGLRCSTLPLACERIIEVQYRDWLLAPSLQKDGTFHTRKAINNSVDEEEKDELSEDEQEISSHRAFGSVPYIARPHPVQTSHTAFLVKLRKILK